MNRKKFAQVWKRNMGPEISYRFKLNGELLLLIDYDENLDGADMNAAIGLMAAHGVKWFRACISDFSWNGSLDYEDE